MLNGTTALAVSTEDQMAAARILVKYSEELKGCLLYTSIRAAVVFALFRDGEDSVLKPAVGEEKVDETGACNLGALKIGAVEDEVFDNGPCNFAGRHFKGARRNHGDVCGEIAVGLVRRNLDGVGGDGLSLSLIHIW